MQPISPVMKSVAELTHLKTGKGVAVDTHIL